MEVLVKQKIAVGSWEIDTDEVACNCPHFKFRLRYHQKRDPRRLCKHLEAHKSELNLEEKERGSKTAKGRHDIVAAERVVKKIEKILEKFPNLLMWEFCGSYRRKKTTIGDLDLLMCIAPDKHPIEIEEMYKEIEKISSVTLVKGLSKARFVVDGIQIDTRNVEERQWPFALLYFTGSQGENIRLRAKAKRMGMTLNEYRLLRKKDEASLYASSELAIYNHLNEPYKTPEER